MIFTKKDFFLSRILKKNCYNLSSLKNSYKNIYLKKNIFLTLKSKNLRDLKIIKNFKKKNNFKFIDYELVFKGSVKTKIDRFNCEIAKKKDKKKIMEISKSELKLNRFGIDNKISSKICSKIKQSWVKNYFKNKRGDLLVINKYKSQITGFLLVIKKKNIMIVDLIAVSKKYKRKKIALKMIIFAQELLFKGQNLVQAGTISSNHSAKRFYKKIGLKMFSKRSIFHYHSN